jgi:hypothetical protein
VRDDRIHRTGARDAPLAPVLGLRQYAVLAGALIALLPLRRGVVLTLLSGAAVGVIIALAAGTVSP